MAQGWTGDPCPACLGHGVDDENHRCPACGGTGDEYGLLAVTQVIPARNHVGETVGIARDTDSKVIAEEKAPCVES